MAQKYQNIPVKPEIYAKVKMIADANGFGERGLGALIEKWVERELPVCDHSKQLVSIEVFSGPAVLNGAVQRKGWFCPTCKRVYQYSNEDSNEEAAPIKLVKPLAVPS